MCTREALKAKEMEDGTGNRQSRLRIYTRTLVKEEIEMLKVVIVFSLPHYNDMRAPQSNS